MTTLSNNGSLNILFDLKDIAIEANKQVPKQQQQQQQSSKKTTRL